MNSPWVTRVWGFGSFCARWDQRVNEESAPPEKLEPIASGNGEETPLTLFGA